MSDSHGEPARALEEVDLLHLLTCATCREKTVGLLVLEAQANFDGGEPSDDDTQEDLSAADWRRMSDSGREALEQNRQWREIADTLFEELMRATPERRRALVRAPRYRSLELLDALLEASHARQLADPVQGDELARLAVRLAEVLGVEAAAGLTRGLCLAANARRLRQDHLGAEALLSRAASALDFPLEQTFYLRVAGLLRCEQGRVVEGEALLNHAARIYRLAGLEDEASACRALLGLSKYEDWGNRGLSLPLLANGWAGMDRELRPALALRCGLALVDCLASADLTDRAGRVLQDVWRLYTQVADAAEMLRIHWSEGRALARMQNPQEGALILEGVWRKLLAEPSPGEAALVSIDLAVTRVETGRPLEIGTLTRALMAEFPSWPALSAVVEELLRLEEKAWSGEVCLRHAGRMAVVTLRRHLRAHHVPIKPMPFV